MGALDNIIRGATTQFGREFGRAGANVILKGANYYAIKNVSDYSGRIKPSDSEIVKGIKELNKVKFVTTNKANVSRLIEITEIIIPLTTFRGNESLNQLPDLNQLIDNYNSKYEHGAVLIDDDFKDKSTEFLESKRQEFFELMDSFNNSIKAFVAKNLQLAESKRRLKSTATILAFLLGWIGVHKFYLGQAGYGVLYILFSWTLIPLIASIIEGIVFATMSQEKFDLKYNPLVVYYSLFKVIE